MAKVVDCLASKHKVLNSNYRGERERESSKFLEIIIINKRSVIPEVIKTSRHSEGQRSRNKDQVTPNTRK
jgi:hypothetical protein